MAKEELKYRIKHLARKFCKRNNVYAEFDGSIGKLIEKSYLSAYLLCLHESKNKITEFEKENAELEAQIEKMKCGGNCKHEYWINTGGCYDQKCRFTGLDCTNCKDKWEIKEKRL